jgi:hypothetical protein
MNLHWISEFEVREAVVCRAGLEYSWDDDPQRGLRVIVQTIIRGRKVLVVLYPCVDPMGDAYNLGSVYFD